MKPFLITYFFLNTLIHSVKAADLLAECKRHADCISDNSACLPVPDGCASGQKYCQCMDGYRLEEDFCLKEAHYGENCGNGAHCVDVATTCSQRNICECAPQYRRSDRGYCQSVLITADYGEKCADSVDCDPTQECSAVDSKCQCLPGYVYSVDKKQCLETQIGDECSSDDQCLGVFNSVCSPTNNICVCESGYISMPVSLYGNATRLCMTQNVELRDIGQPCFDSPLSPTLCKPNLACMQCPQNPLNHYCSRPPTEVPTDANEVIPPEPNDKETIPPESVTKPPAASLSTMEYIYEYYYSPDPEENPEPSPQPLPEKASTIVPELPATTKKATTIRIIRENIADGTPDETVTQPDTKKSTTEYYFYDTEKPSTMKPVVEVGLGQRCSPPSTVCIVEDSSCIGSQCQCNSGFEQIGTNMCRKMDSGIPLGEPCTTISKCANKNATCNNGVCVCPRNHKGGLKGDCIPSRQSAYSGESCSHSIECFYELKCIRYKCKCGHGMKSNGNFDCMQRRLEDECLYDRDCKYIDNSACTRRRCQCKRGYSKNNDTQCTESFWREVTPTLSRTDVPCKTGRDCATTSLAPLHSICENGSCHCPKRWVHNQRRNSCVFKGKRSYDGFACTYSSDCRDSSLRCVNNVCTSRNRELIVSSAHHICFSAALVLLALHAGIILLL